MNYYRILPCDIANGPGVRVSLFVSGCNNECEGCFNPELWDFEAGKPYTDETAIGLLEMLNDENIAGISILGGDPIWQDDEGIRALRTLFLGVKLLYGKDIWLWTGYTWEDLMDMTSNTLDERASSIRRLIQYCDVVVDGPFEKDLANPSLVFRGSSNQRIIDVAATIKGGEIVLKEEYYQ